MADAAEAVAERDWQIRQYDAGSDEGGMMYLLGVGYARSRAGGRAGVWGDALPGVRSAKPTSPEARARQQAFLDAHAPVWRWLLTHADVTLAVDPADPIESIWGWIITSEPNVVHALGCKRSVIAAGLGEDLLRDLAGPRWTTHQVLSLELPQIRTNANSRYKGAHVTQLVRPYEWAMDPTWLVTRMVSR